MTRATRIGLLSLRERAYTAHAAEQQEIALRKKADEQEHRNRRTQRANEEMSKLWEHMDMAGSPPVFTEPDAIIVIDALRCRYDDNARTIAVLLPCKGCGRDIPRLYWPYSLAQLGGLLQEYDTLDDDGSFRCGACLERGYADQYAGPAVPLETATTSGQRLLDALRGFIRWSSP